MMVELLRKVRCPRCGYTWITKSTKGRLTCPNCNYKVRVEEVEIYQLVPVKSQQGSQ